MLSRFIVMCCAFSMAATCCAESSVVDVSFDRWMYPFNASPGARATGSTFGAVLNPQFDDRDAQLLFGFDTHAAGIAAAGGASSYRITSAKLVLTTATDLAFALDSTYDSFASYLDEAADTDAGRPIELYGLGFRNGYQAAGQGPTIPFAPIFEEADSYGPPGPPVPANGKRNAYATDLDAGTARDVSNNVREGFEPSPWAIGSVPSISPGEAVPIDAAVEFAVDLNNENAVGYLQSGLDLGELYFSVVSMHTSVQGSPDGIPSFYLGTSDGASLGQRAQLHLDYELVPEPSASRLALLGGLLLPLCKRRRSYT